MFTFVVSHVSHFIFSVSGEGRPKFWIIGGGTRQGSNVQKGGVQSRMKYGADVKDVLIN